METASIANLETVHYVSGWARLFFMIESPRWFRHIKVFFLSPLLDKMGYLKRRGHAVSKKHAFPWLFEWASEIYFCSGGLWVIVDHKLKLNLFCFVFYQRRAERLMKKNGSLFVCVVECWNYGGPYKGRPPMKWSWTDSELLSLLWRVLNFCKETALFLLCIVRMCK